MSASAATPHCRNGAAGERREHMQQIFAGGSHDRAAMEPAGERLEHGSQILGRLSCANSSSRERSGPDRAIRPSDGLVKIQEMPADLRASAPRLVSHRLSARVQMMTARDEGSFSR